MMFGHGNSVKVAGLNDTCYGFGNLIPVPPEGPPEMGTAESDNMVDPDPCKFFRTVIEIFLGIFEDFLIIIPIKSKTRIPRICLRR